MAIHRQTETLPPPRAAQIGTPTADPDTDTYALSFAAKTCTVAEVKYVFPAGSTVAPSVCLFNTANATTAAEFCGEALDPPRALFARPSFGRANADGATLAPTCYLRVSFGLGSRPLSSNSADPCFSSARAPVLCLRFLSVLLA